MIDLAPLNVTETANVQTLTKVEAPAAPPKVEAPKTDASYPRPGKGNPKFQEWMTVNEAVKALSVNVHSVRSGGGTARVGWVLKQLVAKTAGVKTSQLFGHYRPSDVVTTLRSESFVKDFQRELEEWRKGWSPDVSADTTKLREKQYTASAAWIKGGGAEQIARAIETILGRSATDSVRFVDTSSNNRPLGLIGILDVMMLVNLTASRLAKLAIEND